MNIENLVTMANQIGAFYETMPDRGRAMADIADHIKKFWEPRMRRAILAHLAQLDAGAVQGAAADSDTETQLLPIVDQALRTYRTALTPA